MISIELVIQEKACDMIRFLESSYLNITDPAGARAPHITARAHTGPALGLGHPHMLGLNAGLLGPYVAVVLVTLVVPLTLFQFPGG